MDKSEAWLYFPESNEETIDDQYDQHVFEWKQFFVNRFPVSKLFLSKLSKISRIEEAYSVLTEIHHKAELVVFNNDFPNSLKDSFLHYEKERALYKKLLFQAQNLSDIVAIISAFLEFTKQYATIWKGNYENLEGVVVSKEPDPMELLSALEGAFSKGVVAALQISQLPSENLVVQESKRLSLWLKMEGDE